MAKKPRKASGAEGEGAPAAGRSKTVMIGAAAAVGLLAAGGGFLLMKGGHGNSGGHGEAHGEAHADGHGSASGAGHAEAGGGHGEAGARGRSAAFLEVRDMIVNLTPEPGQAKGGYLKLKVMLELRNAGVEEEVKPLMPRVEDAFQSYMRELRASDLAGSAGLYRLREELLRRVNMAIHPVKAEAVLFKDVVVQ